MLSKAPSGISTGMARSDRSHWNPSRAFPWFQPKLKFSDSCIVSAFHLLKFTYSTLGLFQQIMLFKKKCMLHLTPKWYHPYRHQGLIEYLSSQQSHFSPAVHGGVNSGYLDVLECSRCSWAEATEHKGGKHRECCVEWHCALRGKKKQCMENKRKKLNKAFLNFKILIFGCCCFGCSQISHSLRKVNIKLSNTVHLESFCPISINMRRKLKTNLDKMVIVCEGVMLTGYPGCLQVSIPISSTPHPHLHLLPFVFCLHTQQCFHRAIPGPQT